MDRVKVMSARIESVGYDEKEKILEVKFKAGGLYQYRDVPMVVYYELMHSGSMWRYLEENIKGVYKYSKV